MYYQIYSHKLAGLITKNNTLGLDDNLIVAPQRRRPLAYIAEMVVSLFEALGFAVNHLKSILQPCQELQFLGFNVNSVGTTIWESWKTYTERRGASWRPPLLQGE